MKALSLKIVLGIGTVVGGLSALAMVAALGFALFAVFSPAS